MDLNFLNYIFMRVSVMLLCVLTVWTSNPPATFASTVTSTFSYPLTSGTKKVAANVLNYNEKPAAIWLSYWCHTTTYDCDQAWSGLKFSTRIGSLMQLAQNSQSWRRNSIWIKPDRDQVRCVTLVLYWNTAVIKCVLNRSQPEVMTFGASVFFLKKKMHCWQHSAAVK